MTNYGSVLFTIVFSFFIFTTDSFTLNLCCPPGTIFDNNDCFGPSGFKGDANVTLKNFKLQPYLPNCIEDQILVKIDDSELYSQDDFDYTYVDQTAITNLGYLRYQEAYYGRDDFCILSLPTDHDTSVRIRICKPTCTERTTCVPKCCTLHEVLQVSGTEESGFVQQCVEVRPGGKIWTPIVYRHQDVPFGHGHANYPVNIKYAGVTEWNMSECHDLAFYPYKGSLRFDFRLLYTGEVMYRSWNPRWLRMRGKFCFDGNGGLAGEYSGYENDTVILHCYPHSSVSSGPDYAITRWYFSIMIVSATFLFLTILIYCLLWGKHTIHGFSLLSYFVALLMMQLSFASIFMISEKTQLTAGNSRMSTGCFAIAIFGHFAFIHAFAWMTIVNFDLWCTFRTFKSSLTTSKGLRRYLKYLAFAITLPTVIVNVGVGLDLTYGDLMPFERNLILPDYGKRKCYLSNPDALLLYTIGPIAVLLVVNIFFFICTVCALRHATEGARVARGNAPTWRQSVTLTAKLICVMGIPWVFEVISAITGDDGSNSVPWYWVVLDVLNHSQGIIIFLFFVCKPDILKSLRVKFPSFNRACHMLSQHMPCFDSKACGSRNATMLTQASENDIPRMHHLGKDRQGSGRQSRVETKSSTCKDRQGRNLLLNEATTKV